ncbi:protoporphyrinogen oxidase [Cryobacterium cheniae]|uniref:Coproporphyrinogen III oxidase n=1 Tax=Cryobacterium cheniae TaxID=1259262 RepID=A0A4R8XMM9_9MICO|nr:protoporphyrinogen oxidase [Cryobacterium cheniae]
MAGARASTAAIACGRCLGEPCSAFPAGCCRLLHSRLLSPLGPARADLDLVRPSSHPVSADPSIGEIVRTRMGAHVFNRLVEPLLGSVHAGRAGTLSAQSTAPQIASLAQSNRSLYLGMRRRPAPAPAAGGSAGPVLVTLNTGLDDLIEALAEQLTDATIRRDSAVTALTHALTAESTPPNVGGYRLDLDDGSLIGADVVVVATPAFVSAAVVAAASSQLGALLEEIEYANVAKVCLVYPRSAFPADLAGTGFLVPPEEGSLIVGCTWSSLKWPHLRGQRRGAHPLHGRPARRQPLDHHDGNRPRATGARRSGRRHGPGRHAHRTTRAAPAARHAPIPRGPRRPTRRH